MQYITEQHVREAVFETFRGRQNTKAVLKFKKDLEGNIGRILEALQDDSYRELLRFYQKTIINKDDKVRHIDAPILDALIIEHVWLVILRPIYDMVNPGVARNCLPEHGITARRREYSVLKESKRLFYDMRHLNWLVDVDQRQCYQRVSVKAYRRGM